MTISYERPGSHLTQWSERQKRLLPTLRPLTELDVERVLATTLH